MNLHHPLFETSKNLFPNDLTLIFHQNGKQEPHFTPEIRFHRYCDILSLSRENFDLHSSPDSQAVQ